MGPSEWIRLKENLLACVCTQSRHVLPQMVPAIWLKQAGLPRIGETAGFGRPTNDIVSVEASPMHAPTLRRANNRETYLSPSGRHVKTQYEVRLVSCRYRLSSKAHLHSRWSSLPPA